MITSASNQQMKNITALLKKSKERKRQGLFVVEGPKMCFEAPEGWLESIYVSESFINDEENKARLMKHTMDYEIVADNVLKAVSDTMTPQGIIATVRIPSYSLSDIIKDANSSILLLESIQDPGNLGTMFRTGEGAGISGVVMNKSTVDLFNPKTIRSTMGSIYRMPFVVVDDMKSAVETIKDTGISLYAAHLKGTKSYDEPDYKKGCGFMIGNEGKGLSDELADMADEYIRIPMEGQVESLNAAIAATILMYEANRQRRK